VHLGVDLFEMLQIRRAFTRPVRRSFTGAMRRTFAGSGRTTASFGSTKWRRTFTARWRRRWAIAIAGRRRRWTFPVSSWRWGTVATTFRRTFATRRTIAITFTRRRRTVAFPPRTGPIPFTRRRTLALATWTRRTAALFPALVPPLLATRRRRVVVAVESPTCQRHGGDAYAGSSNQPPESFHVPSLRDRGSR
jgi:hypothetical protein